MGVGLPVGVDLKRPEPVGDDRLAVADLAPEQIGQRVGGVGGDEQAAPPPGGGGEAERGGRRRLADAPLAADEEQRTVQGMVEQGGAPV